MKIAVAAQGDNPQALTDPRFGRCRYFVIVDSDTGEFEAVENPGGTAGGGAGIQAAQAVGRSGADVVIAGNYGPNAYEALAAGKIEAYTNQGGTVAEAVEAFKAGRLTKAGDATVPSHFGMGTGGQR